MENLLVNERELLEIGKKYKVTFLGVFGSYAREDSTSRSDIDILVRFAERKSLLDIVRIEREWSEILGTRVDLLTEKSISPYLRDRIRKELKVIYDEEG